MKQNTFYIIILFGIIIFLYVIFGLFQLLLKRQLCLKLYKQISRVAFVKIEFEYNQHSIITVKFKHIPVLVIIILTKQEQAMDASAELSFLNCYICFESLKKPKMCPSCSKVACQKCLRTWIEDNRPECPHCRKMTPLSNFAECERFISDVKHLLGQMEKNEKVRQKCTEHRIQMTYYCEDCQVPICSDCGMFGVKHRGHKLTHLKRIYQDYKNRILNQLARFDQKIDGFRKNGYQIKFEMQKLVAQIGQRKSFIQQYFVAILERLDEQFKQKQDKIKQKYDSNSKQIEFLESFRQNICRELQSSTQNELITKSSELIGYIQSVYDKGPDVEYKEHTFDTIHEIVPKYNDFRFVLKDYESLGDGIIYSVPFTNNGIEWRLKIYPKGNGSAKNTHMSVFLQMTKAFTSGNKYEYKIQLINNKSPKDSVIREYSSNFDIGECWGYNQFIPIQQLSNDFITETGDLVFAISVRNPSYRSLVRDQKQYIQSLQSQIVQSSSQKQLPSNEKLASKQKLPQLKKQSKDKIRKILYQQMELQQSIPKMNRIHSSGIQRKKEKEREREKERQREDKDKDKQEQQRDRDRILSLNLNFNLLDQRQQGLDNQDDGDRDRDGEMEIGCQLGK